MQSSMANSSATRTGGFVECEGVARTRGPRPWSARQGRRHDFRGWHDAVPFGWVWCSLTPRRLTQGVGVFHSHYVCDLMDFPDETALATVHPDPIGFLSRKSSGKIRARHQLNQVNFMLSSSCTASLGRSSETTITERPSRQPPDALSGRTPLRGRSPSCRRQLARYRAASNSAPTARKEPAWIHSLR